MSKATLVHVCVFDSGFELKARTTYAEFRAAILKAGRFSVFEATETARSARMFTRLCRDPEIKTTPLGFPWTRVSKRRSRRTP